MLKVVIYSTRTCPFCNRATALLNSKGIEFDQIFLEGNTNAYQEMIQKSQRTSVPQIFIDDYHVGGCDDLYKLEQQGQLNRLLGLDI